MAKTGKGRGSNPNSWGNNKKAPEERTIAKEITLYPDQWNFLYELGDGNHSEGVRVLVNSSLSEIDEENVNETESKLAV